jgi:hypothetical protein
MKRLGLIVIFIALLTCPSKKTFAFELFDGRLHEARGSIEQTMNWRTHRDDRDVAISSLRTVFRIEGEFDLITSETWDVMFYGLFNYWYDGAVDAEANLRRAVKFEDGSSSGPKELRRPNVEEEIVREAYFDINAGAFELRLGKQLVSWGETAESRVADLINPLDLNNIIAFPDWEDFKVGLWMGRFFYTPENMWQDLSFELVVIPPDFQSNRLPSAGSGLFFGVPQFPEGVFGRIIHKQEHDIPTNDLSNTEIGFRIRGYTKGADWTLSNFYTRVDSPIIDGSKGFREFTRLLLLGYPTDDIYTYPHFNSTAFTVSRPWDWIKSTIRAEAVLNTNKYYPYGTFSKQKAALLTTALTWLHYRLFGHKFNKATGEFISWESGKRDSTWNKLTLTTATGFIYDTLITQLQLVYDFNGNTTVVGALVYRPGDHWIWKVIYQQINEAGEPGRMQDQMIFSMRYEF